MAPFFRVFLWLTPCLLCATSAHAQPDSWEVGGWLGTSVYFGDLNTNYSLRRLGPSAGAVVRYNIDERICLRSGFDYAFVSASDTDSKNRFQQARNLSFRSHIFEGSLLAEFNFLDYNHLDPEKFFSPYLAGGIAIFNFSPQARYEGHWVNLQPLGTEGQGKGDEYYRTQVAFAYAAGIKFNLNQLWSLNLELAGRRLFTDYLDDVHGTYADPATLRTERGELSSLLADRSRERAPDALPIGQLGRQRGDSRVNDMYVLLRVGLVYSFAQIKCPTF